MENEIKLDFISMLEKYLLVRTKMPYVIDMPHSYKNRHEFSLKCTTSRIKNNKDVKIKGIKEMIAYLRGENITYSYDKYTLDVFDKSLKEVDINGKSSYKSIFHEILELNPTEDELFNLYIKLGDKQSIDNITKYFKEIKSKEFRIKVLKNGFDYKNSEAMVVLFSYLNRFELSEKELNEILRSYVDNSTNIKEETESIVKALSRFTRNKEFIEYWVKEITQEDYRIELFKEKTNHKIEMSESALLYQYPVLNHADLYSYLDKLISRVNNNHKLIKQTKPVEKIYYDTQINEEGKPIHIIIVNNDPELIQEVKNIVIIFLNMIVEMNKEERGKIKEWGYHKNEEFENLIFNARLKTELKINTGTKTNKI